MDDTSRARIVVGVDGSPDSLRALRTAARLAPALDATIDAIAVWEPPIEFGWTYPVALRTSDWRAESTRRLEGAVDQVFGAARPDGLSLRVVAGYPAAVLIEASKGAALLIVGTRGHGGFASLLLGSVSVKCVEHATCPVLVARGDASIGDSIVKEPEQRAVTSQTGRAVTA